MTYEHWERLLLQYYFRSLILNKGLRRDLHPDGRIYAAVHVTDTARNEAIKVMWADENITAYLKKSKRPYRAISFGFQPRVYGFGIETFNPEMQVHGKKISLLKTEEIQISDKGKLQYLVQEAYEMGVRPAFLTQVVQARKMGKPIVKIWPS